MRARRPGETNKGHEWLYVFAGRLRLRLGELDPLVKAGEVAEFDTPPRSFGRAGPRPVELLALFGLRASALSSGPGGAAPRRPHRSVRSTVQVARYLSRELRTKNSLPSGSTRTVPRQVWRLTDVRPRCPELLQSVDLGVAILADMRSEVDM